MDTEIIKSNKIPPPANKGVPKYLDIIKQVLSLEDGQAIKISSVNNSILVTFCHYQKRYPIKVIRRHMGDGVFDMYLIRGELMDES